MMRQYLDTKAAHPDALLFFHVGDFYELFYDDAVAAARALGLTLTSRDGTVPMCGVPVHAVEAYLSRLVEQGYKVAVCDQLEDPKLAKGLVRRAVTRVVTPGTYEGRDLEARMPLLLAAYVCAAQEGALAWLDGHSLRSAVATGDKGWLEAELRRLAPQEVLLAEDVPAPFPGVRTLRPDLFAADPGEFPALPVEWPWSARRALSALWRYSGETAGVARDAFPPPAFWRPEGMLALDEATLNHLEVFRRPDGSRAPTLLSVLDRTVTAAGARLLRDWVLRPLVDREAIVRRQEVVATFFASTLLRERVRLALKEVRDVERAVNRLASGRGGVPELYAVLHSLTALPGLAAELQGEERLTEWVRALHSPLPELCARLAQSLRPEAEGRKDNSAVADGVLPALDEARRLAAGAREELLAYEEQVRAESGIRTAKVGYNRVFGYYIEVGRSQAANVPSSWTRRQTVANAERYVTPFLSALEGRIAAAELQRDRLEAEVVAELKAAVVAESRRLAALMQAVAELDVLAGLATLAVERGYVRPELTEELEIAVVGGRHPVLETVLPAGRFVPNDLNLSREERLVILTGPNMAGKSTVLRQTALLQILAQIGSFVPARSMRTGVLEAIFTRIGAADDLAGGRSTFMVEMSEVARILAALDRPCLVLLDEVGRGTSTYDGLSLAWAIAEELHRRPQALTLLATHYLELADLPRSLPQARNFSVAVQERGHEVLFLHRVVPGPADRSYGLHVARLAGVPERVVARAERILAELEAGATARRQVAAARQQEFRFADPPPDHPVVVRLREVDVNELRPVDALLLLEELVHQARGEQE